MTEMGIGEVAKRLGMTLRAIRFYEDKGIVSPVREGTRRMFDENAFRRLRRAKTMSDGGVPLAKIHAVLEMEDAGRVGAARAELMAECERIDAKNMSRRKGLVGLREMLIDDAHGRERT